MSSVLGEHDIIAKGIELTTHSHDERFITNTSNQLWVCAEGKVTKYMGDVESYKVRFNLSFQVHGH